MYSLSEIDAQCKKAARGAGLAWGYAEEAGKTARYLAALQLPGASLLAHYLPKYLQQPEQFQTPAALEAEAATLATLCPIQTAAYLCDKASSLTQHSQRLEQVTYPLLLLPSIMMISQSLQSAISLTWQGTQLICHQGMLWIAEQSSLDISLAQNLEIYALGEHETATEKGISAAPLGQVINEADWQVLAKLAHNTYVAATEASRKGAGPAD